MILKEVVMYSTQDFRKGLKIEYNDKAWSIVDFQHVSPGKGSAFVRTKLKNLESGQVVEITFKSGDKVNIPDVEMREMQYLYSDTDRATFMDVSNYEQFTLTNEEVGDAKFYIVENGNVRVTFFRGRAVAVEVDNHVDLKVVETQPNIKGDTSGGGGKPATLQTGLIVQVPFHIKEGDILKIDTRTNEYLSKV
jgi:elongation factor P